MEREKKTISGALLEVDFYPVFSDGRRVPMRGKKQKPTSEEQKKYNRTVAIKKMIRLVNANFDGSDYLLCPTYSPLKAPADAEAARRDMRNYLRRIKTKRTSELKRLKKALKEAEAASALMPDKVFLSETVSELKKQIEKLSQPFKYIYVIEEQVYKTGIYAGLVNYHFHCFVTGGLPEKVMESMWLKGMRINCNNYQPERFGPEAAARYMGKDPKGSKRFSYSKNLEKSEEKIKDGKISKKTVENMATRRVDDRAYWEKKYKGYRFLRCFSRFNPYNGHWYVSVVMYRSEADLCEWGENEWITSDFIEGRDAS